MVNDEEITGDYTVTKKDDVTVIPVLSKTPGPGPEPTPDDPTKPVVNPTGTAKTGDMIYGVIIGLMLTIAFAADMLIRKRRLN